MKPINHGTRLITPLETALTKPGAAIMKESSFATMRDSIASGSNRIIAWPSRGARKLLFSEWTAQTLASHRLRATVTSARVKVPHREIPDGGGVVCVICGLAPTSNLNGKSELRKDAGPRCTTSAGYVRADYTHCQADRSCSQRSERVRARHWPQKLRASALRRKLQAIRSLLPPEGFAVVPSCRSPGALSSVEAAGRQSVGNPKSQNAIRAVSLVALCAEGNPYYWRPIPNGRALRYILDQFDR